MVASAAAPDIGITFFLGLSSIPLSRYACTRAVYIEPRMPCVGEVVACFVGVVWELRVHPRARTRY